MKHIVHSRWHSRINSVAHKISFRHKITEIIQACDYCDRLNNKKFSKCSSKSFPMNYINIHM